jgi:hypothetical protein
MGFRPRALSALSLIAGVGLVACSASTRSEAPVKPTACAPSLAEQCKAGCGDAASPRDTPERKCEGVVHDLCLAHCAEECGGRSPELTERIGGLEGHLDRECGSGQPIAPEDHPRVKPEPTPGALDRLLR